jgi:hypothetical protein
MVKDYNLFILAVEKAWCTPARKEQRTLHHLGDGRFKVDGRSIDLRARMTKWKDLVD